jgi:hypothetical protein
MKTSNSPNPLHSGDHSAAADSRQPLPGAAAMEDIDMIDTSARIEEEQHIYGPKGKIILCDTIDASLCMVLTSFLTYDDCIRLMKLNR